MAPGVSILAAMPPMNMEDVPAGKKPSSFSIKSGTSMACPHVAGAGAFLKSAHPRWTPSIIRSALMTTGVCLDQSKPKKIVCIFEQNGRPWSWLHAATARNNLGLPVASSSGAVATVHDMGAGEIIPLRALNPGLVFDTTTRDYLDFLCYQGYKDKVIRKVSGDAQFTCPHGAPSPDLIAKSVNYPSISVPQLTAGKPFAVSRTATNVGRSNATYVVAVEAPPGLSVKVSPKRLLFSRRWATAAYEVRFAHAGARNGYAYGAVTWSDGLHSVRTPFAVNVF
uniref:Subtilisin-like protease n=1 Tax=Aegilops tauschii subsp. strangulata TaxID=200361 RepID=A0A453QEQ9_AEGTS